MTEDKVQLHVDVPRPLWKAMKQAALDGGDTLKGIVEKALETKFGVRPPQQSKGIGAYELAKEHREKELSGEPIMGMCVRCGDRYPVNILKPEPRSGKLFCPDCVENMKGGV